MQVSRGLGRGLGALIPNLSKPQFVKDKEIHLDSITENKQNTANMVDFQPVLSTKEQILHLPLSKIDVNPNQPRRTFSNKELEELADSIRQYGILQPLIVAKGEDRKYNLIAGERRLRAAKIAGLQTVPVIVRQVSDLERLELALIENIQRQDLNPLEYTLALNKLINEFNLTQQELAKRLGKNRSSIANSLRYLDLPPEIQESLSQGQISEGQAKIILSLPNKESQLNLWQKIKVHKFTVRQTEDEARKIKTQVSGYIRSNRDVNILSLEQQIESTLGTKVKISGHLDKGRLMIEYYSAEELNNLVKLLGA